MDYIYYIIDKDVNKIVVRSYTIEEVRQEYKYIVEEGILSSAQLVVVKVLPIAQVL